MCRRVYTAALHGGRPRRIHLSEGEHPARGEVGGGCEDDRSPFFLTDEELNEWERVVCVWRRGDAASVHVQVEERMPCRGLWLIPIIADLCLAV